MVSRSPRRSGGAGRGAGAGQAGRFRAGSFSGAARSLVHYARRDGVRGWLVNTVADALLILVRTALAFILALGLVALAIYAAGARIGEWLERHPEEN